MGIQYPHSQRSHQWDRVRRLGAAIRTGDDPGQVAAQARELVDLIEGLEEWRYGPLYMVPVVLDNNHMALAFALAQLALARKTGSSADRPGWPRLHEAQRRWAEAQADDLEELLGRLGDAWSARENDVK
jgi:hypothetical protein